MAVDKLVDSTKLDACLDAEADAIRAKTGGSSDILFDYANNKGFADAIAAIPSGGGGTPSYHLFYDETLAEEVDTIRIDIPANMQNYKIFQLSATQPANSPTYPYVVVNKTTGGAYVGSNPLSNAWIVPTAPDANTGVVAMFGDTDFTYPAEYIYIKKYYSGQKFQIGTNIKVYAWG